MKNLLTSLSASVLAASFLFVPVVPSSAGAIVLPKPAVAQPDGSQAQQVAYYIRRGGHAVVRRGPVVGGWHGAHAVRGGYWHGYRGYRNYRPGYRLYNGWWFPAGAFATGAVVGGAYGMTPPAYAGAGAHVQWCANRYRSYRVSDNTFQPINGPRRQCVSPY